MRKNVIDVHINSIDILYIIILMKEDGLGTISLNLVENKAVYLAKSDACNWAGGSNNSLQALKP